MSVMMLGTPPLEDNERSNKGGYLTLKSDMEKQRHSSQSYDVHNRPDASRCDHEKVWWGRNKKPIYKLCQLGINVFPYIAFLVQDLHIYMYTKIQE